MTKRIIGLLLILGMIMSFGSVEARGTHSSKSYKTTYKKSYSVPHFKSTNKGTAKASKSTNYWALPKATKGFKAPKQSYKLGTTNYLPGEYYKATGLPKVERSMSIREEFLQLHGYDKVPYGFEVDHIIPLFKGGPDATFNMQLLPKSVHEEKTKEERKK